LPAGWASAPDSQGRTYYCELLVDAEEGKAFFQYAMPQKHCCHVAFDR